MKRIIGINIIALFIFAACASLSFGATVTKTIGTDSRDYSTITLWENDLDNIDDFATLPLNSVKLTVAAGERHDGTAGDVGVLGARIDYSGADAKEMISLPSGSSGKALTLEWLELDANGGSDSAKGILALNSHNSNGGVITVNRVIIHDVAGTVFDQQGIEAVDLKTGSSITNSIIYDIHLNQDNGDDAYGIRDSVTFADHYIYNVTVHNTEQQHASATGDAYGIGFTDDANVFIKNCIATDTTNAGSGTAQDFQVASPSNATFTDCLSSDASAPGTTYDNKTSATQFVSNAGGAEDLHLKAGADAIGGGADLTTSPTNVQYDIDNRDRDTQGDTWDIGADQYTTGTLSALSVTPSSTEESAITNHTIAFTTTTLVPVDGDVEIVFDSDYDLTGTLAVVSGNTGATVSDSGSTLIINLGTQVAAAASPSIVISGIKNPATAQTTDTFAISTETDGDADIDTGTAAAVTITAKRLRTVQTRYTYDATADELEVSAWLEQEGELITNPTSASVVITNNAGNAVTGSPLTDSSPSTDGVFYMTLDASASGANLSANTLYLATTSIIHSGTTYTAGPVIKISIDKNLSTVTTTVDAILVDTGTTLDTKIDTIDDYVDTEIADILTDTGTTLDTKLDDIDDYVDTEIADILTDTGTTLDTKLDDISGYVDTEISDILTDTGTTLPDYITDTAEKGILSQILNRDTVLREDETVEIRYRTTSGLAPTMTVYDEDGSVVSGYSAVTMTEISTTGIYEYDVEATASWDSGDYTVICEESTQSAKDSMILTVKPSYAGIEASIDILSAIVGTSTDATTASTVFGILNDLETTIDGLALTTAGSDASNAKSNALKAYEEIIKVKTEVTDIGAETAAIKNVMEHIEVVKADVKKVLNRIPKYPPATIVTTEEGTVTLGVPAEGVEEGAEEGEEREVVPEGEGTLLIVKGEEEAAVTPTREAIINLNNRVEELTALLELLTRMVEETTDEPVVEGWFELE
jgi:hypothetical protein